MTNNIRKLIDSKIREFNSLAAGKSSSEIDNICRTLVNSVAVLRPEHIVLDAASIEAIVLPIGEKNTSTDIKKLNNVKYEVLTEELLVLLIHADGAEWATYSGDSYFEASTDKFCFKENCVYHKTTLDSLEDLQKYHF